METLLPLWLTVRIGGGGGACELRWPFWICISSCEPLVCIGGRLDGPGPMVAGARPALKLFVALLGTPRLCCCAPALLLGGGRGIVLLGGTGGGAALGLGGGGGRAEGWAGRDTGTPMAGGGRGARLGLLVFGTLGLLVGGGGGGADEGLVVAEGV